MTYIKVLCLIFMAYYYIEAASINYKAVQRSKLIETGETNITVRSSTSIVAISKNKSSEGTKLTVVDGAIGAVIFSGNRLAAAIGITGNGSRNEINISVGNGTIGTDILLEPDIIEKNNINISGNVTSGGTNATMGGGNIEISANLSNVNFGGIDITLDGVTLSGDTKAILTGVNITGGIGIAANDNANEIDINVGIDPAGTTANAEVQIRPVLNWDIILVKLVLKNQSNLEEGSTDGGFKMINLHDETL